MQNIGLDLLVHLDGTQTHKWVLEGLFGPSYKIIRNERPHDQRSCCKT